MDLATYAAYAGVGFAGSIVKIVLEEDGQILFPRIVRGNPSQPSRLELGFVGNAIVGMATAIVVDNSLYIAFFSAVSGSYLLELVSKRVSAGVRRFRG